MGIHDWRRMPAEHRSLPGSSIVYFILARGKFWCLSGTIQEIARFGQESLETQETAQHVQMGTLKPSPAHLQPQPTHL